jgi:four helix bundle protein
MPNQAEYFFDHEKLDVYQLELRFVEWVTVLLEETRDSKIASTREVRDQLDRASISTILNTAEGNGKRQRQVRAKFFDDARGSATESAACLDVLVAKRVCTVDRVSDGKGMLLRIVQMLAKLVQTYSVEGFVRESGTRYLVNDECKTDDEHDDEDECDRNKT